MLMVSQRTIKRRNVHVTDHEIDLIRELHEVYRLGYGTIARKFEVSKSTVQKWCRYRRR